LFIFDACLMANVEVICQIAEYIEIYGASEESEAGDGWPYDRILKKWYKNPSIDARNLSRIVAEEYVKSSGEGNFNTIFSVNLNFFQRFTTGVLEFSKLIFSLSSESKRIVFQEETNF
jgi:hypothetical protein